MIYFVQRPDGAIKIGTTVHYGCRVRDLKFKHGSFTFLGWVHGGVIEERELHERFAEERLHSLREWFNPSERLQEFIRTQATSQLPVEVPISKISRVKGKYISILKGNRTLDKLTPALVLPMTRLEAEQCIVDIRKHLKKADKYSRIAKERAYDLSVREGWKALGYKSFFECAKAEFNVGYQYVYRMRDAVMIERQIADISPEASDIEIPESHARKLKALPTPQSRYEALKAAERMAHSEGSDMVSSRHIDKGIQVAAAQLRVFASPYTILAHMVTTGDLSLADADDIGARLDRLKPATKGYIFQQIAAAGGIGDPALVTFIGNEYERQTEDNPSLVLQVLEASGYIGGTPLKRANMTNVNRALYEQQLERESDQTHTADDYGPVHLTLLKRNAELSWAELRKMMGDQWIDMMRPMFLQG